MEFVNNKKDEIKSPLVLKCRKELEEYFYGNRMEFSVKLDVQGTDFQVKCWKELSKIPYGESISYKEQAENIGNPKAVRAVGGANGKNPIGIIVPCHRADRKKWETDRLCWWFVAEGVSTPKRKGYEKSYG